MSDVKEYARGKKTAKEQLDQFGPAGGCDILECKAEKPKENNKNYKSK
jgi:hypothetical protein